VATKLNGRRRARPIADGEQRKRELTVYVSANILSHPKFVEAGRIIGPFGIERAVAMFLAGLAYSRKFLTDGTLPVPFPASSTTETQPDLVENALSNRRVRLWHRTRDGFVIHDYLQWNRTARQIKELRAASAERQRRHRAQSS
jgi:hypothetical protein